MQLQKRHGRALCKTTRRTPREPASDEDTGMLREGERRDESSAAQGRCAANHRRRQHAGNRRVQRQRQGVAQGQCAQCGANLPRLQAGSSRVAREADEKEGGRACDQRQLQDRSNQPTVLLRRPILARRRPARAQREHAKAADEHQQRAARPLRRGGTKGLKDLQDDAPVRTRCLTLRARFTQMSRVRICYEHSRRIQRMLQRVDTHLKQQSSNHKSQERRGGRKASKIEPHKPGHEVTLPSLQHR
mmetsp:Transcript_56645/g.184285  ORF Transcript_56645/g.184285 Transcript_56645/m.184285 type:complete len:246 (-) Transcript_56645:24-761(-)